ncbi:hypothetical protein YC2023_099316 [Brassica napus]
MGHMSSGRYVSYVAVSELGRAKRLSWGSRIFFPSLDQSLDEFTTTHPLRQATYNKTLIIVNSLSSDDLSKVPTIAFGDPLSFGGDPLDHPLRPRPSRSLRLISISSIDLYRFSSRRLPYLVI